MPIEGVVLPEMVSSWLSHWGKDGGRGGGETGVRRLTLLPSVQPRPEVAWELASLRQAGQQGGGTSWDLGEMESHRQGRLRGDLSRALHLTEGESEAQRGCGLCPKVITEFCRASSESQVF